jgi:beta-glucosidase/6-phospho-beta-glucosidase/beta-galactosidase
MGRVDEEHPLHDWLLQLGASSTRLEWLREHAVQPDVIGVNYYPAFTTVRFDNGRERPVEAGVDGLEDLLLRYQARYALPLMLTETSRGGDVGSRRAWLEESLACVHRLRAEGLPLLGYTWFPFLALVDWLYREDDRPVEEWLVQMGLVDLVPVPGSATLERVPTELVGLFWDAAQALVVGSG